jgi:hypothetical protein
MKHQSKFSQNQEHTEEQRAQAPAGREFANSDELLRHDAASTPVPPAIEERLKASVGHLPAAKPGWLKRLFGGGKS